jgi:hypothetical protein
MTLHVYSSIDKDYTFLLPSIMLSQIRALFPSVSCVFLALCGQLNAQLLDDTFTAGKGHSDGSDINNTGNWLSQTGWIANDTNGRGYVSCGSSWSRALNFTPVAASLETEETLTVEAIGAEQGWSLHPFREAFLP